MSGTKDFCPCVYACVLAQVWNGTMWIVNRTLWLVRRIVKVAYSVQLVSIGGQGPEVNRAANAR